MNANSKELQEVETQIELLFSEIEQCVKHHRAALAKGNAVACARWLAGTAVEMATLQARREHLLIMKVAQAMVNVK